MFGPNYNKMFTNCSFTQREKRLALEMCGSLPPLHNKEYDDTNGYDGRNREDGNQNPEQPVRLLFIFITCTEESHSRH